MSSRRVVVTGIGALSCVGNSVDEMWKSVVEGRCGLGPITRIDATDYRTKIAGEIKGFDACHHLIGHTAEEVDNVGGFDLGFGGVRGVGKIIEEGDLLLGDAVCGEPANNAGIKFTVARTVQGIPVGQGFYPVLTEGEGNHGNAVVRLDVGFQIGIKPRGIDVVAFE